MDWNAARSKVAEYFSDINISRNINQKDILDHKSKLDELLVGPIDWSWGKNDIEIDSILNETKMKYIFRSNQVDFFIAEAGILLDRSLGDLNKYDDLSVERFKVIVEFMEFDRINVQQNVEKNDVIYWNGFAEEARLLAEYSSRLYANKNIIIDNMRNAINRYDASAKSEDNTKAGKESAFAAESSARAAYAQYLDGSRAASFSTEGNTSRMNYHIQSRIHQIERQDIQREIIELKLMEMLKPGGAINYNERMHAIGVRAFSDFLEVTSRLNAISIGMYEFYGIDSLPQESIETALRGGRTRIEGAVSWLRKAVNLISRNKMNENTFIIRKKIEISGGNIDILRSGISIIFDENISGYNIIQIKGVSCCLESSNVFASLDLEVISPEQKLSSVDISLPSVSFRQGRISSVDCNSVSDVYLGRSIVNRSPKGEWRVKAVGDAYGETIRFLNIDFHLSLI